MGDVNIINDAYVAAAKLDGWNIVNLTKCKCPLIGQWLTKNYEINVARKFFKGVWRSCHRHFMVLNLWLKI